MQFLKMTSLSRSFPIKHATHRKGKEGKVQPAIFCVKQEAWGSSEGNSLQMWIWPEMLSKNSIWTVAITRAKNQWIG